VRVLIVDDSEADALLLSKALQAGGYRVQCRRIDTAPRLREALAQDTWDIVLYANAIESSEASAAMAALSASGLDLPVIVVAHAAGEQAVLAAMRQGASDYILKHDLRQLVPAVERALSRHRERLAAAAAALQQSRARVSALEDHVPRAQRMESLGRLAGAIAHDFNNLLTVIGPSAEFVLERLPASHALRVDIRNISGAAQQGAELVRQLLAFSQGQRSRAEPIDVTAKLQAMRRLLARTLGGTVELRMRLAGDVAPVEIDPAKLEQVLLNLVVNARDAMPDGGALSIELAQVELDPKDGESDLELRPGTYVRLAIIDTGMGMTDEVRARAFEPFFTTKEHGRGTGLGLAAVYGIITHGGGAIDIESQPGRGTRIDIYLPAHGLGRSEQPVGPPRANRAQGDETILLVDDADFVRRAAARVLRAAGYTVLEANGGAAAIALCERFEDAIDLVLTDVMMPGVTGTDLAAWLRTQRFRARVLFTSGSMAALSSRGTSAAPEFLEKPFTTSLLLKKVRSTLDRVQEAT
jgi:signal transduction histidine kinase